jgi:hypothetical protein
MKARENKACGQQDSWGLLAGTGFWEFGTAVTASAGKQSFWFAPSVSSYLFIYLFIYIALIIRLLLIDRLFIIVSILLHATGLFRWLISSGFSFHWLHAFQTL